MISEAIKEQDSYQAAFRALQSNEHGLPRLSWLERLRESAMDRFEVLGFPALKDEEWKYTNVAPIARLGFAPITAREDSAAPLDASQLAPFTYPEAKASQLVFVNGILNAELSSQWIAGRRGRHRPRRGAAQ